MVVIYLNGSEVDKDCRMFSFVRRFLKFVVWRSADVQVIIHHSPGKKTVGWIRFSILICGGDR